MKVKDIICTVIGAVGGVIAAVFGGWTPLLTILFALNVMDFFSGLTLALVFQKSPKTETGAASSREVYKGICRKLGIWALVLIGHFVDYALNLHFLRDAVAIGFMASECVSIVENVCSMGVSVPEVLLKAIDILRRQATNAEKQLDALIPADGEETKEESNDAE